MTANTRSPRLLVKLTAAPPSMSFSFANQPLNVSFERLFASIGSPAGGLGAAPRPEWHIMTPTATAAEVNAWDLCHHLVTQGFGVAGLSAPEAAEPDFEQRWITGTPVEHALAASRTCDKPNDPDSRLPSGSGNFWFRDSSHSQLEAARAAVGQPADRIRKIGRAHV